VGYPNVAAEPSMYCPRLRMTPLGPGPCLKIVYPPIGMILARLNGHSGARWGQVEAVIGSVGILTEDEAHRQTDTW